MNLNFNRLVAVGTLVAFLSAGTPLPAHAGLIGSAAVIDAAAHSERERNLSRVQATLARADVRQQMQALGVDADAAAARVAALSDSELSQLSARIDQAPAGGEILAILGLMFLVLLILDYIGVTKIFRHG